MNQIIAPVLVGMYGSDGPGLIRMFYSIGAILLILAVPAAALLRNPPPGFVPAGYTPPTPAAATGSAGGAANALTTQDCIASGRFAMMWIIFFCNITAGIMFIGFQSPMLQDLLKMRDPSLDTLALAGAGATLIAISSIFNGIGRFFWGGLSDKIGRIQTFRIILASQILVFAALIVIRQPLLFSVLVCYVLLCYGGGFGSMPSFVLDTFGQRLMPAVYGTILTAWSFAGIVGPQIVAIIKDMFRDTPNVVLTYTFVAGTGLLIVGFLVALLLNNRVFSKHGVVAE